jgi:hypothetical protein
MTLRAVACAWCNAELLVPSPDVGDGYFLLPRQCRHCAGQNVIEVSSGIARTVKRRRRQPTKTQKLQRASTLR